MDSCPCWPWPRPMGTHRWFKTVLCSGSGTPIQSRKEFKAALKIDTTAELPPAGPSTGRGSLRVKPYAMAQALVCSWHVLVALLALATAPALSAPDEGESSMFCFAGHHGAALACPADWPAGCGHSFQGIPAQADACTPVHCSRLHAGLFHKPKCQPCTRVCPARTWAQEWAPC